VTLFDGTLEDWKAAHPEHPVEVVSAYRQRTRRAAMAIADGRHPVTGFRLLNAGWNRTCGDCDHHIIHAYAKRYHKCELRSSSGPATDIRVSWPACTAFRES
jgi:hypothetical protein